MDWVAEHSGYRRNEQFVDRMVSGPVDSWVHTHRFRAVGASSSEVEDAVAYRAPLGPVGALIVRRHLPRMFTFRHRRTYADLARQAPFAGAGPLRIAVTGASGLVGRELVPFLTTAGHRVDRLVRRKAAGADEISWDPERGEIDAAALEGVDAVVHLAGESFLVPWTRRRKQRIRASRVEGTRLLSAALARLRRRPRVLVSASGANYYGDRGDKELDEGAGPGAGFLAELCVEWEAATAPAADADVRVVTLRNGVVLSGRGGALKQMAWPVRLGVGGTLGGGRQYVPWIAVDDLVGAIYQAIHDPTLSGAVNTVAPEQVTNGQLTATLGRVLRRPTVLPVPAAALRALPGGMGRELVLASVRAGPRALEAAGFRFEFPTLEDAVRFQLGR
jgi:uncharacterized protein (TIGR01777 family)